jgi:hypothetical protein
MKMTDRTRVLPSRRTLLGGLAAAGTLAAVVMVNNGAIVSGPGSFGGRLFGAAPQSALATAEMAEWQTAVGTRFEVAGGITLRLVGIQPLASSGARPAGLRRSAFMAVFDLPAFASLPGNLIYTLRNSTYGQLDLFLDTGAGRMANRVFAILN